MIRKRFTGLAARSRWKSLFLAIMACSLCCFAFARVAQADGLDSDLTGLASTDGSRVTAAIEKIEALADPRALRALHALDDGKLRFDEQKHLFIQTDAGFEDALSGAAASPRGKLDQPASDNEVRRALAPALASLSLSAPSAKVRLAATRELGRPSDDVVPALRKALGKETDPDVKKALALALAPSDLASEKSADRIRALEAIRDAANAGFKGDAERLLAKDEKGRPVEPDPNVRAAAKSAVSAIETRQTLINAVGNTFYGLSLGSVLILCALGLAITFGLMRVINMAHGEMMMIGAYTAFVVQNFFIAHLANHLDWYLVIAAPMAFVVSGAVGVLMERTVIRHLYGRPLETLLATWGISLLLIQTVRLIFGAQNVTVANPTWLSGGVEILPDVVLTYSRLVVIAFSIVVVLFVWALMQKTRLGLEVRAVTQNREMAAAMGISTRRVDMWTFGIGSGVAGLGGIALSQLGNVGPELGQGYIVDSFMVVVLGGVGKLAGTIAGGLGLGLVNKYLEPVAGAVLGKIFILVFIIIFIQRRPQGIFALKGRAAEVS
ncbi:MAG TPA: urea ABC transporter permease subunit UrtB [Polyangiaceae bacterium]|nr:urea ABC transporter permease subunit UrtB [Polyangiaceae bacterium]